MSSPTITALDALLALLGIAPLKLIIQYVFRSRKRKREAEIKQAIKENNHKAL
ncbi:MAG: hypothetical protein [Bacteriophage sp.]|nr:MAG: hypothetical protein [Bacteriophage sp.]